MTEAFKDAVIEYLRPYEGNFNYENMLRDHIDISRFYLWVGEVPKYRAISGSTVLSSGCGSAGDLQVFLEMGASKAHGIEVSEGLADLARLRFQGAQFERRVEIVTYDGSILPYVDVGLSFWICRADTTGANNIPYCHSSIFPQPRSAT